MPEGLEPASAGPQQGLASASSSLANLPSRTRLLTNYWKSNRMPVTYLPVHDTTPAVTVTSCDADSFARLVSVAKMCGQAWHVKLPWVSIQNSARSHAC